jgi:hypothetical protein
MSRRIPGGPEEECMNRDSRSTMFLVIFIIFVFYAECAYIDPGTGSFFIMILIGFLSGIGFTIKMFWKKIVAFLKGERPKKAEPTADGRDKHD